MQNLKKIVRNNDYDGIDNAFNLYMVMRQERDLLDTKFTLDKEDCITEITASSKLNRAQQRQL